MPMDPNEIKAALVKAGVKQADIARSVGKSKQLVGDVIRRHRRNTEIEQEVAARIGKPVKKVFAEVAA
jgi:lambda repressor-like predicted transcriptional regulator